MAVIDVAGYVAELKDHAVDHKFHVHDERHFVETYSLRQFWEVDLHPEEGCGGPIDLHLALEVEPRVLLDFEDAVVALPEDEDPPDKWFFPLTFNWGVPPLPKGPDLLRLAIDLAGVGGVELPLEISATDSFGSVTDAPVRRLTIVARQQVSLARVLAGRGAALRHLRPGARRDAVLPRQCPDLARRVASARPRLVAGLPGARSRRGQPADGLLHPGSGSRTLPTRPAPISSGVSAAEHQAAIGRLCTGGPASRPRRSTRFGRPSPLRPWPRARTRPGRRSRPP